MPDVKVAKEDSDAMVGLGWGGVGLGCLGVIGCDSI